MPTTIRRYVVVTMVIQWQRNGNTINAKCITASHYWQRYGIACRTIGLAGLSEIFALSYCSIVLPYLTPSASLPCDPHGDRGHHRRWNRLQLVGLWAAIGIESFMNRAHVALCSSQMIFAAHVARCSSRMIFAGARAHALIWKHVSLLPLFAHAPFLNPFNHVRLPKASCTRLPQSTLSLYLALYVHNHFSIHIITLLSTAADCCPKLP